jgi:hypothetical protein
VQRSGYSAEFGRAGGGMISLITKSGFRTLGGPVSIPRGCGKDKNKTFFFFSQESLFRNAYNFEQELVRVGHTFDDMNTVCSYEVYPRTRYEAP